jgi:hypothetical protein
VQNDERRQSLRRMDDVLEALEQLNLNDITELNDMLARRLVELGITDPYDFSIPQLIEKVWALQQPFLITIVTERRRRRRRSADADMATAAPASG